MAFWKCKLSNSNIHHFLKVLEERPPQDQSSAIRNSRPLSSLVICCELNKCQTNLNTRMSLISIQIHNLDTTLYIHTWNSHVAKENWSLHTRVQSIICRLHLDHKIWLKTIVLSIITETPPKLHYNRRLENSLNVAEDLIKLRLRHISSKPCIM